MHKSRPATNALPSDNIPLTNPSYSLSQEEDLIRRFVQDVEQAGLVGEKNNATTVFLCAVSAHLQRPLNVTVQGASSGGKNHLIGTVARFIPDDMQKFLTGMTPKVLMHAREDEYEHKAVFIAEYEGVSKADYAIRTFQSEQVIKWEFVQTSSKGIEGKKKVVRGPAAFIQATTRPVLHPENETRLLFIQIDESAEHTRAIMRRQAQEAAEGRKSAVAKELGQTVAACRRAYQRYEAATLPKSLGVDGPVCADSGRVSLT